MSSKKFKIGKAQRVANITFEGTDFDGLEIRCSLDLPLKTVMKIQSLMLSDDNADSVEANTIWCDEVLESWNLTDDEGKEIPANSEVELKPGAKHIMLMGLKRRLDRGQTVSVTLHFQHAGMTEIKALVFDAGSRGPKGKNLKGNMPGNNSKNGHKSH